MKKFSNVLKSGVSLAVVATTAVAMTGCSEKEVSPKEAVKASIDSTIEEVKGISDGFGTDAINEIYAGGKVQENTTLFLKEANVGVDLSSFYGSGLTVSAGIDVEAEKINADVKLDVSGTIATVDVIGEGSKLYFGSTELMGDQMVGIDFEDVEGDMAMVGLTEPFDIFEYANSSLAIYESGFVSEDANAAFDTAFDTLLDSSTFAEAGVAETIEINGATFDAMKYSADISGEALSTYITSVVETYFNDTLMRTMMEQSIVLSGQYASYDEYVADMIASLEAELALLDTSAKVDFFVEGGFIRGIDVTQEGATSAISIRLGGANIVDHMSLEITDTTNQVKLMDLDSTGNHTFADGKFTNETTMIINDPVSGTETAFIELLTDYTVDAGAFTVSMDMGSAGTVVNLAAAGSISMEDKAVNIKYDDLTIGTMGMGVSLIGDYSLTEASDIDTTVENAKFVSELTPEDMSMLQTTVMTNATMIAMELQGKLAALGLY